MQSPMISSPLKQTNEIDWIAPLKSYIRHNYGDDPERYTEECATLNRLRQDMRGAAKDSPSGRDVLYKYFHQLENLDLRFPVDENHIKISFTWLDAFTHRPTAQHSLAFEKASIIFNIAAVLSCLAAAQNRSEEIGVKTAYHSFQASAGMFTYINENFLHAPSTDLNHDTVKTLIALMLAQAQEVFFDKQVADGKKPNLVAKLASQAAFLYNGSLEGVQENVTKSVFEKVWLQLAQFKAAHFGSVAQYYQALADDDTNAHGTALARLALAEKLAKDASKLAYSFPTSPSPTSNIAADASQILNDMSKRNIANIQEKIVQANKDNDFIYHDIIPSEASLSAVPKVVAAKAITISDIYQGQDVQRIIGHDIFQRIVPMSVTESASLYDEEKAKMLRAENERAEIANSEMAASLDYLKLPGNLTVLKGGMENDLVVDDEFRQWCQELASRPPFGQGFEMLGSDRGKMLAILDQSSKKLDMEESVCEKMRSRYGSDWTQQPSSRLNSTLRGDIRNYRRALEQAATSDAQLQSTLREYEADFDEMRSAGHADEADVLYQRAMIKAGAARGQGLKSPMSDEGDLLGDDFDDGSASVADLIAGVEELIRKLSLIKRERAQMLKDLKEKVHNDDISHVLIHSKKAISNQETQLFKTELEKFRPLQVRLLQANHKQSSVFKELTRMYSDLLKDKRVRSEQNKYELYSRQRGSVMNQYRKIYQAFTDLQTGLDRAKKFYSDMHSTVESQAMNVDSFVGNRKAEGGELLGLIEQKKAQGANGQGNADTARLQAMMGRMNIGSPATPPMKPDFNHRQPPPPPQQAAYPGMAGAAYPGMNAPQALQPQGYGSVPPPRQFQQQPGMSSPPNSNSLSPRPASHTSYNPGNYTPLSPPTSNQSPHMNNGFKPVPPQPQYGSGMYPQQGFVPPPPPTAPPPGQMYGAPPNGQYNQQNPQQYGQAMPAQTQAQQGDPWAALSGWK